MTLTACSGCAGALGVYEPPSSMDCWMVECVTCDVRAFSPSYDNALKSVRKQATSKRAAAERERRNGEWDDRYQDGMGGSTI